MARRRHSAGQQVSSPRTEVTVTMLLLQRGIRTRNNSDADRHFVSRSQMPLIYSMHLLAIICA